MASTANMGGDEQELVSALQRIDAALGTEGGAGAAAEAFNPCEEYDKIRDVLDTVIDIASKLPFGVGKRIARVLRKLKEILDALCPAS